MSPHHSDTTLRRRDGLVAVLLFLGGLAWFWFWRTNVYTGGDSGQWDRTIYEGWWLQRRQLLSFAVMQATFRVMRALATWTSMMAISLTSCLSGAFALVILWRMFRWRPRPLLAVAAVGSAGFTLIYYGHIETYAMSVTALLFHLLAVQRSVEDRWPMWTIVATYVLMLYFHLIAIFILPAVLLVLFLEARRRRIVARDFLPLALAASPVLLIWLLTVSGLAYLAFDETVREDFFVAPPRELVLQPWKVFTHRDHRGDLSIVHKFWFTVWNAGFFAVLAPWVFWAFRRDRVTGFLLAYGLCFLAWKAIWSPLQYAADFDLFCFPWVVAAVVVGRHLAGLPFRAVWIGLLLGANVLLFLSRPAVFAEVGMRERASLTLAPGPWNDEVTVFLDESFKLPEGPYRYLPAGAHVITIRKAGWPMIRRTLVAEAGESFRIEIGERELRIIPE
jgi:hypothetical protein